MTNKAFLSVKRCVREGEKIAVAVSGGRDSMCLLHFLINYGFQPLVIHIEHGIRGEQSLADAHFVEEYAKQNGLCFMLFSANIPLLAQSSKRSIESEARAYRKSVFEEVISSGKADVIMLAHHELDQAETVLMHFFRGSGLSGLKGMAERDGYIARPLLSVSKAEIEQYIAENNIVYHDDQTNFDCDYDRNFIRNKLIPDIESRYPVVKSAVRLAGNAAVDEDFIVSCLDKQMFTCFMGEHGVKIEAFEAHEALVNRYIMLGLSNAGLKCDLEKKHIEDVKGLVSSENGSEVCLPHDFIAVRDYDRITFYQKKESFPDQTEFMMGITPFGRGVISVTSADGVGKGELTFDGDKIPDGAVVRFRREGDLFTPFGGGTKKLKEYFIDKKIPRRRRDFIPLVCDGNRVLIVIGVEISDGIKITNESGNRLKITYSED